MTPAEFRQITESISNMMDDVRKSLRDDIEGMVHEEAMRILNEETSYEFHKRVRAALKSRVYVEVKLKEKR